ncbi:MAG: sugar isomerase [Planctomycetota bacterium]|nr:MAG: sugar isomerase [Planctomycetota bacterium]
MPHKKEAHNNSSACSCCSTGLKAAYQAAKHMGLSRRHLILGAGTAAVGGWALKNRPARAEETKTKTGSTILPANQLIVQPVLTYSLPQRQEKTSWRHWGGIMDTADLAQETRRINNELRKLTNSHNLSIKLLPLITVNTEAEAAKTKQTTCDVMLIYGAGAYKDVIDALVPTDKPVLFFLRHKSGPVYLWYEILHPTFLRQQTDDYQKKNINVEDVIVDDYEELAWRLNALSGLRKTLGQKIVAIGGAGGWGLGHKFGPTVAREKWHLDIIEIPYPKVGKLLEKHRSDERANAQAAREAEKYMAQPNIELHTDVKAVQNSFLLYNFFKNLMIEHQATAFTIKGCMLVIIPMAETTACLPLSLLNDEGYLAFCESDFAVIPAGMLMHHITGTPAFLNDPTWPHHGMVTLAHCTAPRKMDGKNYAPTKIYTHFESDYGAAPKVEMAIGREVTMVVPDFQSQKWIGAKGKIVANPFHDICRSQIDVAIDGDWQKLLEDMRGFHWMMVYGDCRKEVGYAIKHLGIEWKDVSA